MDLYNRYSALPKSAEIIAQPKVNSAASTRKFGVIAISTLTVFTLMMVFAVGAKARGAPDSFADLVETLSPAVVNISTTQTVKSPSGGFPKLPEGHPFEDFFKEFGNRDKNGEQRERKATSLGSGFVIDAKDGYVITNNHVIDGAEEIKVIFKDGESVAATLVGTDPKTDIAVLKVDPEEYPLVDVGWGDSDKSRVGDWVLAIGNPYGLGGTVTAGIISARGRDIRSGPYDDYIQTDASINKGNSGGPLFNMDGEVIGINTAIFSQSGGSIGIGFSVPSELAIPVVEQLIEFGKTSRGWLGVVIQPVTEEIAEGLDLKDTDGVLVAGVPEDGPAFKAGIKAGDVILKFNGETVSEPRELSRLVAESKVGSKVTVDLWRSGKTVTKEVTLGELEKAETAMANGSSTPSSTDKVELLGMELALVNDRMREQFNMGPDASGVVVTDVDPNSEAAEKGIRPGDIVAEAQLEPVSSPEQMKDRIAEIQETDKKSVLLLLKRGDNSRFIALKLNKES
ncbi:Do family serine endopeptidase [Sneathiella sp. DP05]|uniref:Probable periplasmic serine endoprotease DegP-like n=2 Tax=Sneathiella litorea TaxID=2606216 RepID=A0A6L8WD44_9PROT|nr:DegQ family serine endoprotease [Sneathiella litorea]MZR32067.1 Do family serine endopeptidase [Sneathiella litorea]